MIVILKESPDIIKSLKIRTVVCYQLYENLDSLKMSKKRSGVMLQSKKSRELVDRLRELGLDKHIELPKVAVMGDTSSGKSSVLSALSGISFPINDRLTTRCPTQVILSEAETFSGSVHLQRENAVREGEERLNSIEEVGGVIERLTQQLVDEGQYISDDSIVIDIKGPGKPNLTLTDLPGLVRTTADGEDENIIERIRALVNRYLIQKRTIILAVVPANVDMHNTEILQAAFEADPDGVRTVAIITKPDLVDDGAESSVFELLLNEKKKLKRGFHAVRCRGQRDHNNGMDIRGGILQARRICWAFNVCDGN